MLIARFGCGLDAVRENAAGFVCARFASQKLAVHLISGNISSIAVNERAKVLVCGGGITTVHAFERQPIARERIPGLLGHRLFEHLAAGFLLCGR